MTTSAELAEQYWAGDLDCHRATQEMLATGKYLADDHPLMVQIFDLDSQLGGVTEELGRRAGRWAEVSLTQLVAVADDFALSADETLCAAAALRVLTTDSYIEASEALQPGVELPAVGVYAELD